MIRRPHHRRADLRRAQAGGGCGLGHWRLCSEQAARPLRRAVARPLRVGWLRAAALGRRLETRGPRRTTRHLRQRDPADEEPPFVL